jgi:hypothetical protein
MLGTVDPNADPLIEAIELALVGLSIVFVALLAIMGMLTLLRLVPPDPTVEVQLSPKPKPAAAAVGLQEPAEDDDEISPQVLTVISAAVCAALGPGARVRRVRIASPQQHEPWAEIGRKEIHSSHRLPRRHP